MMKLRNLALATALMALPATAMLAQTTYSQRHHVAARKGDQQARITQGDRSGQLTGRETAHLENHEQHINQEEKGMRAADGGHLTAADRHTLARQQNRESQRIYNDKHNAKTDPGVPPR